LKWLRTICSVSLTVPRVTVTAAVGVPDCALKQLSSGGLGERLNWTRLSVAETGALAVATNARAKIKERDNRPARPNERTR
jgi:hypothetical protein